MELIRAKYTKRGVYKVIVSNVVIDFCEPFSNNPKKYEKKINELAETLKNRGIEIEELELWKALKQAAARAERHFPDKAI